MLRKLGWWERQQLRIRKVVNSPSFDMFFALVVVSNSLMLGIEVETNVHEPGGSSVALEVAQYLYAAPEFEGRRWRCGIDLALRVPS